MYCAALQPSRLAAGGGHGRQSSGADAGVFRLPRSIRASTPQLAPLYTGLSFEDSSAIVEELQKQNIPNEIPRRRRHHPRAARPDHHGPHVARREWPADTRPGRLRNLRPAIDAGRHEFRAEPQQCPRTRRRTGPHHHLAWPCIKIAPRVHLVLPERALFSRDKKDPTASIVVAVRGQLSAEEIGAIQHVVASAVEGLTPSHVTIADDAGNLPGGRHRRRHRRCNGARRPGRRPHRQRREPAEDPHRGFARQCRRRWPVTGAGQRRSRPDARHQDR